MQKSISALAIAAILALGVSALSTDAFAEDKVVAVKVGAKAPAFELKDTEGKTVSLAKALEQKKIIVLEWFNPGCPFVKKHHQHNKTMKNLAEKYKDQVVWLAINSSAEGKQGYGAELNQKFKKEWEITYPILLDSDGAIGRAYGAKTTPHMYVINAEGVLVYAGAIDDDSSAKKAGETNYVADAIEAVIAGGQPEVKQTKSYGCSVKYAAHN